MLNALLILQTFHVLFLALHDWVPLGSLNDPKAVRAANPGEKLLAGTLISPPLRFWTRCQLLLCRQRISALAVYISVD